MQHGIFGQARDENFLVQKKWYLDVKRTPCAREALMHGIVGGMGMGILYFLKSSECIRFKWIEL